MKSKQMWVVTLTEKGRKPILTDFVFSRWKSAAIADLIKFFVEFLARSHGMMRGD